jgi:hypothetical protein
VSAGTSDTRMARLESSAQQHDVQAVKLRHALRMQVRICRERTTGKVCAMKKLRKSEMVRRGQVRHVCDSTKSLQGGTQCTSAQRGMAT